MTIAYSGDSITFADNSVQNTAATGFGFKNRIINGAMVIDQRNAGASVTGTNYVVDRWQTAYDAGPTVTSQRSTTAPAGFVNSTILTVTASASPSGQATFRQYIEGFNAADFGWGSASAQTVTLSFWVRSSVTGTYAVAFQNAAFNRSYVATYTVSAANTYEYKTVTIAGDTSGTWATDNTSGVRVFFDLGCTTSYNTTAGAWGAGQYFRTSSCVNLIANSGATFYITGVQLEKGSTATSFDHRTIGTEILLSQRYYQKSYELTTALGAATTTGMVGGALGLSTIGGSMASPFPVQMRTAPTMTFWDSAGNASKVSGTANGTTMTTNLSSSPNGPFNISQNNFWITGNGTSTYAIFFHFAATAEL